MEAGVGEQQCFPRSAEKPVALRDRAHVDFLWLQHSSCLPTLTLYRVLPPTSPTAKPWNKFLPLCHPALLRRPRLPLRLSSPRAALRNGQLRLSSVSLADLSLFRLGNELMTLMVSSLHASSTRSAHVATRCRRLRALSVAIYLHRS